jgi:hypothetical protein
MASSVGGSVPGQSMSAARKTQVFRYKLGSGSVLTRDMQDRPQAYRPIRPRHGPELTGLQMSDRPRFERIAD